MPGASTAPGDQVSELERLQVLGLDSGKERLYDTVGDDAGNRQLIYEGRHLTSGKQMHERQAGSRLQMALWEVHGVCYSEAPVGPPTARSHVKVVAKAEDPQASS